MTGKNPFKANDNKQMLINNYICSINFTDIELSKQGQKFASSLLCKEVAKRPDAKRALEDDVFCVCESSIGVDLILVDQKYSGQGPENEPM